MIIFGVDPGFALTGYGIIEVDKSKMKLLEAGCISTKAGELFTERCEKIYNELSDLIKKYKPDAFAIEELFFNSNQKTAIMVAQGRGVAVLAATHNNVPVYEYTPLQVKQSVAGYGRADKNQVQQMVKIILKLDKIIKPDDAADAVAIAISHAYGYRGAHKI
ncbi:MAG: crossover junction endodeoxyribonuclease RuvC [Clostridia bacterium]|nr:crossover junction endodeoxyribonuclease RuvC [Clostridia bacterium]